MKDFDNNFHFDLLQKKKTKIVSFNKTPNNIFHFHQTNIPSQYYSR